MYAAIIQAKVDDIGPDITGQIVPMLAGTRHIVSMNDINFYLDHPDAFTVLQENIDAPLIPVRNPITNAVIGMGDPVSGDTYSVKQAYGSDLLPVIESFSKISQWTVAAADPTNANIAASTELTNIGYGSLRFTSTASSSKQATIDQDQTINLNATGGFWLCWNNRYKQTSASVGLTAYMSLSTGLAGGVGRVSRAGFLNTQGFGAQSEWVANTDWATLDGTPDFTANWLSWRFRIDSNATEPHDWQLDGIKTGGIRPKVMISFDDGLATSYSIGFAEAQKREIPLTHYLIGSLLGAVGYITSAQALEMVSAGDYLGAHGAGGPGHTWNVNTSTQVASDIAALAGISDGKHGAWPEGNFGLGTDCAAIIQSAKNCGLKTIRGAGGASVWLPGYTELGAFPSYPLASATSLAAAKAAVDRAIAAGGVVTFYGHNLGAVADGTTWVTSDFTALLDYIAQKRMDGLCDVVTIKQLYDGMTGL